MNGALQSRVVTVVRDVASMSMISTVQWFDVILSLEFLVFLHSDLFLLLIFVGC